jgi:transposase
MTRLELTDIFPLEKPWYIADVHIEQKERIVVISVEYNRLYKWVDNNGQECRIHAHEERAWRHIEIMEYSTRIVCRVPRLIRPDGGTQMAEVPWANSTMRITKAFEKKVAVTLRETTTISGCCKLLHLS